MTAPAPGALFAAIDATWPAARVIDIPGWQVRQGEGGGNRVSAATATEPQADIAAMEAAQAALGQTPLVMVRAGEEALDSRLEAAGYRIKDPVTLYLSTVGHLAKAPPPVSTFRVGWPPMRVQTELWAAGGIGPERLAVMARARQPQITFLGRCQDQPSGTAFVAVHDGIAMLHALEVSPGLRRSGSGRNIMHGAALWAQEQGAAWLAVLVTRANAAGNALYRSLGMDVAGQYHYRSR